MVASQLESQHPRPGPPCAHRAHGPRRRVTGASPAQRQHGVM